MGSSKRSSSEDSASSEEENEGHHITSIPSPQQQRQQGTMAHSKSSLPEEEAIFIKDGGEKLNCTDFDADDMANQGADDFAEVSGIRIQLPALLPNPTLRAPVEPGAYRVYGLPEFHRPQNLEAQGHPQDSSHQHQTPDDSECFTMETHGERCSLELEGQDRELASAWPVSLHTGVVHADPVTKGSRRNNISFCAIWKSIALVIGLCLLVCAAIAMAVIFLNFQIHRSDPAKLRHKQVKAAIEQVLGNDYFDTDPKEKALHWLVYNDTRHWGIKHDHEEDMSTLIQRFLLVSFYFQTSTHQPWNYCNPPEGKQTDLCYYQDPRVPPGRFSHATRWLTEVHECRWMGVECEGGLERVSMIRIIGNNMTGHVPSELSKLNHIKKLNLRNNQLSGSLPLWIEQLTSLESLTLSQNLLTGTIPSFYFLMPSLETLNLESNLLTGTIALHNIFPGQTELTENQSWGLGSLLLQANLLTGPLPLQLYSMAQLKYLCLGNNDFNGSLSSKIGSLVNLQELGLEGNKFLSGSIPPEVGFLQQFTRLDIRKTNIGGTIPDTLFSLGGLRKLSLRDTNISGTISTRIGLLTDLRELDIAGANLSGTIPQEISELSGLVELYVNGNMNLTGSMPAKFCSNRLQGDKFMMARIIADCTPLSSSGIPVIDCPGDCCTTCCDAETKICKEH